MCITNKRFLENAEVMLAGKDKIGTEEKELERIFNDSDIWDKVFKNGLSKVCGRQPLNNLKLYCGLPKQTISLQIF